MVERYQIICPDCRVVLPEKDTPKVCPNCNRDITDTYEILFRPAGHSILAKRIALVILLVFAVLLIAALGVVVW